MRDDDADAQRPETAGPKGGRPLESATPRRSHLMSRRGFVSRSAQVASLSLFGVMGFDAVADLVLRRVEEISGGEGIAAAAAHHLRESGLIRVAHADCTYCRPADEYTCNQSTQPAFTGCGTDSYDFECQWMDNFYCVFDEDKFDCLTTYSCPPTYVGFTCFHEFSCTGGSQEHACQYDTEFTCGGPAAGYLCPSAAEFYSVCPSDAYNCAPPIDYGCAGRHFFTYCVQGHECTSDHTCAGPVRYQCDSSSTAATAFECGEEGAGFTCNGGSLYDFECTGETEDDAFACNGDTFRCAANHEFMCVGTVDFKCDAGSFHCNAGGNQCNVGMTGDYSLDQPGDFECRGSTQYTGGSFACQNAFYCQTSDDFLCGWGSTFSCTAPFEGCGPASGEFQCTWGADFECEEAGGNEFEYLSGKFSVFDR